jgi:hypothetical protein
MHEQQVRMGINSPQEIEVVGLLLVGKHVVYGVSQSHPEKFAEPPEIGTIEVRPLGPHQIVVLLLQVANEL